MGDKEKIERAFIAQAAELIVNTTWETNWSITAEMFMFLEIAYDSERLFRSQSFQDSDYPERVLNFLRNAHSLDSPRAIGMVIHLLKTMLKKNEIKEEDIESYPLVKAYLNEKEIDKSVIIPRTLEQKYLNIKTLPDEFYYQLVEELNRCYIVGIYTAMNILSRKLLENLLIDVLRKKFGTTDVSIFYDVSNNRFHSFNELIGVFKDNIDQFRTITPTLSMEFVDKLNRFREVGNASAHSLVIVSSKKDVDEKNSDFEYVVKTLVRLFNNIR